MSKFYKPLISFPYICPYTSKVIDTHIKLTYHSKSFTTPNDYFDKYIFNSSIHNDKCFFCSSKSNFIDIVKGYSDLCSNKECYNKATASSSIDGIMYSYKISYDAAVIFKKEYIKELSKKGVAKKKELSLNNPNYYKERSQSCVEYWIKRKGYTQEEAEIKVKAIISNMQQKYQDKKSENPELYRASNPLCIEYYTKDGISEEEAKKTISNRQSTFSLKICIDKYGYEEGVSVFKNRQEKWQDTLNSKPVEEKTQSNVGYSSISQKMFWEITSMIDDTSNIHFAEKNAEYSIKSSITKQWFNVDFLMSDKKKIIEFQGDYFHCNPLLYHFDYVNEKCGMMAKEIWDKDLNRKELLINEGYDILYIWESEYIQDSKETLEKCYKYLVS